MCSFPQLAFQISNGRFTTLVILIVWDLSGVNQWDAHLASPADFFAGAEERAWDRDCFGLV